MRNKTAASRIVLQLGILLALLIACLTPQDGLAQKLWSQVKLNRTSAYIGEPIEVSITVYTSTWFTSGLDPGNIQVKGAYTVYFRPVSVSLSEGGTTYPGIQLIYHVFPHSERDIVFPSLTLEVETPKDGDYIGVKHHLKTQERTIKIKPVPPGFDKNDWLVANGMYVSDYWTGNLKQVKVGDVLERRISRTVYGTVGELIPPTAWDSIGHISMYPDRSLTKNNKGKTSISSSRTDGMRYLFEEEGQVTLPEMVFTYFHPYRKRLYKKTLKAITIDVAANPDLGILKSVRDSLLVQEQEVIAQQEEEQPWSFMGLSPEQLALATVLGILVLYLLAKTIRRIIHTIRQRKKAYRASEAYYFDLFKKATHHDHAEHAKQALYRWIDELKLGQPTLEYFVGQFGTDKLQETFDTTGDLHGLYMQTQEWKKARAKYLLHRHPTPSKSSWINPQ
ncbi:hypothetical protein BFP72_10045 [Reichenbachiella sp. 5M10]|nr:hypothetical protein BFP72_10045 [Reichenbachiella sp. 5M10]